DTAVSNNVTSRTVNSRVRRRLESKFSGSTIVVEPPAASHIHPGSERRLAPTDTHFAADLCQLTVVFAAGKSAQDRIFFERCLICLKELTTPWGPGVEPRLGCAGKVQYIKPLPVQASEFSVGVYEVERRGQHVAASPADSVQRALVVI